MQCGEKGRGAVCKLAGMEGEREGVVCGKSVSNFIFLKYKEEIGSKMQTSEGRARHATLDNNREKPGLDTLEEWGRRLEEEVSRAG